MKGKLALAAAFAAGLVGAKWADFPRAVAQEAAAAPKAVAATNVRERNLDALLYVQTAAEYRACCLQTYRLAAEKLKARVAALPPNHGKPPAVVLDLDETVLDNSAYQRMLDRENLEHTRERWAEFERDGGPEVRLVPGARDFLLTADAVGIRIVFISNRTEKNGAAAREILNRLLDGLLIDEFDLMLQTDSENKTLRRAEAARTYRVAMWIGDQLTDFDAVFAVDKALAPAENLAQRNLFLDERQGRLGEEWFVLPNPMYGEWIKPAGRDSENARKTLRPTALPRPRA